MHSNFRQASFKRLSHNSKSQQKEAKIELYIRKYASIFAKYLIMGQALKYGVCDIQIRKKTERR
jgi:hypothetical protein